MNKGGRATWLLMGGLGIVLFLAAYGLVALETSQTDRQSPQRRTTYSAAAGGYKALYLWLQSLDLPVGRWEKSFGNLPQDSSVLVLVEPELGPGTGEMEALKEWVSDGRTLVLIASRPNPFLKNMEYCPPSGPNQKRSSPPNTLICGRVSPEAKSSRLIQP